MVSLRNIVCALGLAAQAIAYTNPIAKCGWTGCKYEPAVAHQQTLGTLTAPSSDNIVKLIQTITVKSQALQAPAASLTIVNGPLVIAGLGPIPQIVSGFVDIVATATTGLASVDGIYRHLASDDEVFEAFRDFVRVHQALLSILIGRSGLFTTVPFVGAPLASALRQIEAVVDTLAFLLIDTVQSRSTDIQALAASLGQTLDLAIKSYSGI